MKSENSILGKIKDHKPSAHAGLWSFALCGDNILKNQYNNIGHSIILHIRDTLCPELSWSHYHFLMRIRSENRRDLIKGETSKH